MPSYIRGTLPLPVRRTLKKLGSDIRDARLRRRIRASTMAERALISRTTLHKIERGDAGVSMGMYATVLFVLGMHDGISDLADRSRGLPMRVGRPKAAVRDAGGELALAKFPSTEDDHLRNHGFLYEIGQGWRLSPAYDLNPVPTDVSPRVLTTYIDEFDGTASLDPALATAEYYGLSAKQARRIAGAVGNAVSGWQDPRHRMIIG